MWHVAGSREEISTSESTDIGEIARFFSATHRLPNESKKSRKKQQKRVLKKKTTTLNCCTMQLSSPSALA